MTTQPFRVEAITPEHMRDVVAWDAGLREDTGIGIAAAFAHMEVSSV